MLRAINSKEQTLAGHPLLLPVCLTVCCCRCPVPRQAMKIDQVDQVLDDINEANDQMKQIQDALAMPTGLGAEMDEDDLLQELEVRAGGSVVGLWGGRSVAPATKAARPDACRFLPVHQRLAGCILQAALMRLPGCLLLMVHSPSAMAVLCCRTWRRSTWMS